MIEVITTCVNYGDYFNVTLPLNYPLFDKMYVVTSSSDIVTQTVCAEYSDKVECIVSDIFFENGAIFNKGKGINLALKRAAKRDWMLITDADIILPSNLRDCVAHAKDKKAIYAAKRVICPRREDLNRINSREAKNTKIGHPLMGRFQYPVVGYFQLFHSSSCHFTKNPKYREDSPTAAVCDLSFAQQWPEEDTLGIKSHCIHLGMNSRNWNGRVTGSF